MGNSNLSRKHTAQSLASSVTYLLLLASRNFSILCVINISEPFPHSGPRLQRAPLQRVLAATLNSPSGSPAPIIKILSGTCNAASTRSRRASTGTEPGAPRGCRG